MFEKLKDLWEKWKIQVTVVGGILVVVTAYGTCTYEPPEAVGATSGDETTGSEEVSASDENTATTTAVETDEQASGTTASSEEQ